MVVITVLGVCFVGGPVSAATAGDLIKTANNSAVYYYDGVSRHPFSHAREYATWYSNFSGVKTISTEEMVGYNLGSTVVVRPGSRLVQFVSVKGDGTWDTTNTPNVYAVGANGTLNKINSAADAVAMYGSAWQNMIVAVPEYLASNYPLGSALSTTYPTGTLVKATGTTQVYYIDGTTKRPVTTDGFTANRFNNAYVLTVNSVSNYTDGTSITALETAVANPVAGTAVVTPTTGGLTVSLGAGNPAVGDPVLGGSDGVLFARFNVTAGSGDAVVTGMNIKRSSLGSYADFDKVWLVVDGARKGSTKTLNSADEASLLFSADSQKVTIANGATKVFELYGSVKSTASSGDYNALGITSLTTSSAVNGLPITGNALAVVTAVAPDVIIDDATIGSTANIGDTAVEVAKFEVKNNESNETAIFKGIALKSIAPIVATSNTKIAVDDFANFKLLDSDNNVVAGPVAMSADGYVRFTLATPFVIPAGTNKYEWFSVTADAVAGPNHVITLDVEEPSDVAVYGGTNMYRSDVDDTAFATHELILNNADFVVAVDTVLNPKARDVAENSTIVLLNANFTAANGPVSATGMTVLLEGADMDLDSDPTQEFDNLRVYVNNVLVSEKTGTDLGNTVSDTTQTIALTDSFSFSGVVPVRVEIDTKDLRDTTLTTIRASITAITGETRDSDGASIASTGTAVGSYATVAVPGYKIYRSSTPVSVTKVKGSKDVDFLGLDIKSNNTTTVKVNKLKLQLNPNDASVVEGSEFTAGQNDVQNIRLYAANGTTLLAAGKALNSSKQVEFTGLNLDVTSNGTKVIVRGDINSSLNDADFSAGNDGLYFIVVSSEGTANNNTYAADDSSGNDIEGSSYLVNVATGLIKVTVASTGTLTVTLSNDSPVSAQLLAGSTNNAIAQYKLVAANENIQVKKFRVGLLTGTAAGAALNTMADEISRVALYDGNTLLAETNSFAGGYTEFDITAKNLMVNAGSSNAKYLTVKVDLNSTTDTVLDSGSLVGAALIDVEAWGAINEVAPVSTVADGFAFAAPVDNATYDLDKDLDASETEVQMTDTTGITAGDIILIGSEQMYVQTVASGTSLSPVIRAFNGTTAAAHLDVTAATDTTVAHSIEGSYFKAYGNKVTITSGSTTPSGTLSAWSSYTDAFKFKLIPSANATEEAVLNSVKISLNTAIGILPSTSAGWYITQVALYNGAGTKISETTITTTNLEEATDTVNFGGGAAGDPSMTAEPISAGGEEFTVKVKTAIGAAGAIETGDKLQMSIANFGAYAATDGALAGDVNWDDSVATVIKWVDMGTTTSLTGGAFSY